MAADDTNARLTLHVFGGCKGESIVLELPDGKWGVVDCYFEFLDQPLRCPMWKFLVDRGVTELEFLCLTHPHDDHYRGMSFLLANLRVRSFWRSAAMSDSRLKWILKAVKVEAIKSGVSGFEEDSTELFKIFGLIKEQRKRKEPEPLVLKDVSLGTQVYPIPFDERASVSIESFAPSGRSRDRYEEGLARCFDESGRFQNGMEQGHHNVASIGLLVVFGETRIVLGGDVEVNGWSDALNEFGASRLQSSVVKVSHHGSTNGYCEGTWAALASKTPPESIVTAFRQHRLPRKNAIEHIQEFASRIVTPHLPAISSEEVPVPLSVRASVKSRVALAKEFHAKHLTESDITGGQCSLTFDASGRCLETTLSPSAAVIWERPVRKKGRTKR